ncbi:MAG: dTDP-4-dehydrorhamnose 3,5-epimerase [Rickettsiaceae bacterium]|nr:dTDP-4-dehydrorhamnose 3,5-epimerase [Rickettsiaceae bacterium]
MQKIQTQVKDLFLVKLDIFEDSRGFFTEKFNKQKWQKLFPGIEFVQDNFSRSRHGVIRGLHAQNSCAKLVGVANGVILDIAVDIRPKSETFGKIFETELSCVNGMMLFLPEGFLHGFQVISSSADVHYKVTKPYNPAEEIRVNPLDQNLNIAWKLRENIIMSDKDASAPFFADLFG